MNIIGEMESEWERCFRTLLTGDFFRKLENGQLTREHYFSFLAEEYFNTTENPRIMALFIAHLDTDAHKTAGKLLKHAAMEMGHNDMALQDLAVLGGDPEKIRRGRALPTTEALAGFISFEIQHRNPKAFLGYLYHMESISPRLVGKAGNTFNRLQIPETAFTFLREHVEADPTHLRWNRDYLEEFVLSREDLDSVLYGLRGTCMLHGMMFQGILDSVEKLGYFSERPAAAKVPG
ncbi:MAG: long-chain acyl-CoA synthetase [Fibrobacteres bacterium]|nr:long-chain acyl-CoA synthetase [Fibrobacterota bacterium]